MKKVPLSTLLSRYEELQSDLRRLRAGLDAATAAADWDAASEVREQLELTRMDRDDTEGVIAAAIGTEQVTHLGRVYMRSVALAGCIVSAKVVASHDIECDDPDGVDLDPSSWGDWADEIAFRANGED